MSTAPTSLSTDRLTQVHAQLTQAVEELTSGEDWARMLETAARFTSYSWNNLMLIAAQCPHARRVAGYRTWQALGRQVRKSERGISILAPIVRRAAIDDEPSEDEERQAPRVLRGFRVAHVFDISQTEGEPLAEVAPVLLGGDAPGDLWERLASQVCSAGYDLVREDCTPANGSTDFLNRTVVVRPNLSPAAAAKTLCHELAHVLLHAELVASKSLGRDWRATAEVEAESVAFLVCAAVHLDTGEYSFPYVAHWAGGDVLVVSATAERALFGARRILADAGLGPEGPDPTATVVLGHSGRRANGSPSMAGTSSPAPVTAANGLSR